MAVSPRHTKWMLGLACVGLAAMLALTGLGVIPADEDAFHAPRFVIVLGGVIFAAGGAMLLVPERSAWGHPFAFVFFLCFAATYWWIAFKAPGRQFEGGVPFLPATANVVAARVLFGLGAALATGIVVHAVYRMFRRKP